MIEPLRGLSPSTNCELHILAEFIVVHSLLMGTGPFIAVFVVINTVNWK